MMITTGTILKLATAIVSIYSAALVVIKIITAYLSPDMKQNERIEQLESMAQEHRQMILDINESMAITQRALLALLAHGIDGNDIEAMRSAKTELTNYLINRK